MNYITLFIIGIVLCFCIQASALKLVGGRTVKSESNFFSSIGRIQAGAHGSPEIMLLGSSITGRLPDRAQGYDGVANMGCDGGSAVDVIRAMDEGRLPRAPILIIEANALQVALSGEGEVAKAMRNTWFQVGSEIPLLSAYARPSAFLYSPLLAMRTGGYDQKISGDLSVSTVPIMPNEAWGSLPVGDNEQELINDIAPRMQRLKEQGSRLVVVWLPPARANNAEVPEWIRKLVSESGAEWWDLGQDANSDLVRLTDSVHMDTASAARTLNSILDGLRKTGGEVE